jgi:hypothetical protein
MSRLAYLLRRIPVPIKEILVFSAGFLLNTVLSLWLRNLFTLDTLLFNVLAVIFVLAAVFTIIYFVQKFEQLLPQLSLSTEVFFRSRKNDDSSIYKPLTEAFISANESLHIVSLFRASNLELTPNRKRHYQALKNMLEIKRKSNPDFRYERIVQVSDDLDNVLKRDQIDRLTLEHCQYLISQRQADDNPTTIRLSKIPQGLSPVSFAIIDNKKILFMIPSIKQNMTGKFDPNRHVGTLIIINSPTSKLIKEMNILFESLRQSSTHVAYIE